MRGTGRSTWVEMVANRSELNGLLERVTRVFVRSPLLCDTEGWATDDVWIETTKASIRRALPPSRRDEAFYCVAVEGSEMYLG